MPRGRDPFLRGQPNISVDTGQWDNPVAKEITWSPQFTPF